MSQTDDLTALVRAWLDREDCGCALYDALEEAGWPLEWRPWSKGWQVLTLCGMRIAHAGANRRGKSHWYLRADTPAFPQNGPVIHTIESGGEIGLELARTAAVVALRRALRGEVST